MNSDVLKCLEYTIGTYNGYMKKAFLKTLNDEEIVFKKKPQVSLFDDGKVEIDNADIDGTILKCLKKCSSVMYLFEKFNIQRAYKYAVLFNTNITESIISNIENIPVLDENYVFSISRNIDFPYRMSIGDIDYILFNKVYSGHDINGSFLQLKFPVIVIINRRTQTVEIRFDSIKGIFTVAERENTVYTKLISEVRKYLEDKLGIMLLSIDLRKIIKFAADETLDDVKISRQQMNFKNGSRADFKTSDNGNYEMPYISELKAIINNYSDELEKCPNVRSELDKLVSVREKTSEYPMIEVDFVGEVNNHVKFTFNYYNTGYCMLSYYSNKSLIGMERMDDVTEFIEENIL